MAGPAPRQHPWAAYLDADSHRTVRTARRLVVKPVAVHRDDDGTVHAVSARCTHLAC